jgi:cell wall-associated NlpC family hydrolase
LLHDRLVLALLVCAVAALPGLAQSVSDHADKRAPVAFSPTAPARTASDPWFPIAEFAAPRRRKTLKHSLGVRVADYAKRFLGTRYLYGGSSPSDGFDCSGFVRYVYAHFGVSLAHSSYAQFTRGSSIDQRALKPGDLVFFDDLGHVGIYIGNGRFIHAPHSGTHIGIEILDGWYRSHLDGARRILRTKRPRFRDPSKWAVLGSNRGPPACRSNRWPSALFRSIPSNSLTPAC